MTLLTWISFKFLYGRLLLFQLCIFYHEDTAFNQSYVLYPHPSPTPLPMCISPLSNPHTQIPPPHTHTHTLCISALSPSLTHTHTHTHTHHPHCVSPSHYHQPFTDEIIPFRISPCICQIDSYLLTVSTESWCEYGKHREDVSNG